MTALPLSRSPRLLPPAYANKSACICASISPLMEKTPYMELSHRHALLLSCNHSRPDMRATPVPDVRGWGRGASGSRPGGLSRHGSSSRVSFEAMIAAAIASATTVRRAVSEEKKKRKKRQRTLGPHGAWLYSCSGKDAVTCWRHDRCRIRIPRAGPAAPGRPDAKHGAWRMGRKGGRLRL